MEKKVLGREDFRRLPPRITAEELVATQPVPRVLQDPREGSDHMEWQVRTGFGG